MQLYEYTIYVQFLRRAGQVRDEDADLKQCDMLLSPSHGCNGGPKVVHMTERTYRRQKTGNFLRSHSKLYYCIVLGRGRGWGEYRTKNYCGPYPSCLMSRVATCKMCINLRIVSTQFFFTTGKSLSPSALPMHLSYLRTDMSWFHFIRSGDLNT